VARAHKAKAPQPHEVTRTLSKIVAYDPGREDATALALTAQSYAVELRLALRGAERRGGYFDPENVPYALEAMPVIEAALQHYCDMLRADRGALREGKGRD